MPGIRSIHLNAEGILFSLTQMIALRFTEGNFLLYHVFKGLIVCSDKYSGFFVGGHRC